ERGSFAVDQGRRGHGTNLKQTQPGSAADETDKSTVRCFTLRESVAVEERSGEARADHPSPAKTGRAECRSRKVGIAQISPAEIARLDVGVAEAGAAQAGPLETCHQEGLRQVHSVQAQAAQVVVRVGIQFGFREVPLAASVAF